MIADNLRVPFVRVLRRLGMKGLPSISQALVDPGCFWPFPLARNFTDGIIAALGTLADEYRMAGLVGCIGVLMREIKQEHELAGSYIAHFKCDPDGRVTRPRQCAARRDPRVCCRQA